MATPGRVHHLVNRTAGRAAAVLCLSALFYGLNPYWFGDAPWYALDIVEGRLLRPDWAHLLWRPMGRGFWAASQALGLPLDPLSILRSLSSVASAGLCMGTYALARRLGLVGGPAVATAALVAGSGSYLLVGGSGASIPAASFAALVATLILLRPSGEEWKAGHGVLAGVALGLSWAFWAPAVLAFPVLFVVAALRTTGGWDRRLARAAGVCAVGVAVIVGVSAATYVALVRSPGGPGLLEWVSGSAHGVPIRPSMVRVAGAGMGVLGGFVRLGNLGRSVKGLMFGDPAFVSVPELVGWGLVASAAVLLLAAGVVGLAVRWRRGDPIAGSLGVIALAALIPVASFSTLWDVSSAQQLALPLPFVAVAVVGGLSRMPFGSVVARPRQRDTALWVAVAFVWTVNVVGHVVPSLVTRGGLAMSLGEVASRHVPPHSLLVVTGQDFRGEIIGPVAYYSRISMLNLMEDVFTQGAAGWDGRLRARVAATLTEGRSVAVLSDLLGEPTPGGIGLSVIQHPTPRMEEVAQVFAGFVRVGEWRLGRYRFVVVRPGGPSPP